MLRGTKKDKRIIYSSILILLSFLILNTGFCQSGTEFWFAAPEITNQTVSPSPIILHDLDRPIKLVCTAFESAATVTVTQPANPSFTPIVQNVPSHQMVQIDLTPFIDIVENKPANSILNWGLKISSTSPVNISYEVQCLENSDAFSLKGNNALGKEFIIPAQDIYSNFSNCDLPARNSFVVISTEDSTTVKVIPSKPIVGHNAQDTVTLLMNKGQTWCARAVTEDYFNHLGGSFVLSDKPVAVTIADDAIYPNCSMNVSLNLAGDQLIPREVASTRYIPTFEPNPLDSLNKVWAYVYSFENSTQVFLGGVSKGFINRGEFMKFRIDTVYDTIGAVIIETNKPVIVYVFNVSSYNLSMCGQPGGEIVPPLNCVGSREVTVYFTGPSQNNSFWHNLFITTQISNMGNIIAAYPLPWGPYTIPISDYDTVPGTNNEWVFVRWGNMGVVFNQPLTISCTTGKFQLNVQNFEFIHYNRIAYWSEFSMLNLGPDKNICPGDSILLDGGYGQQSYLWNTGDTTRKIWAKSAGSYWLTVVSDSCQVTDTINVSYFPFTPVNLGPDKIICAGDSVLLDAGSGRSWYLWNTGDTTQTIWVKNSSTYWVKVSDVYCIVSDTIVVSLTPTPNITTFPLYDSICSGETTNIPLTSNPIGANFHWTATLTSGTITGFSADSGLVINQTLVNTGSTAGIVTYYITPKIGSCTGNTVDFPVTVVVGDSVKVSITASMNNICAGTSVTFTATPTNPGTTPVCQWKVNSVNTGTNSPTLIYTPINGDVIQCILTSSNTVCTSNNPATSNTITMVVNPNLPVSVSVSPSLNPICAGTLVTFTATPTYGGLTPSYQWKVNGGNVGTNSNVYSYTPNNGDLVTCTLISSETCTTGNPANSNQVTMTVNPLLSVNISISPSSNPFCIGNSVIFTATPTWPGTTPIYQWKVNGLNVGANNPVYTYNSVSGDIVTCVLTSSELCTSNNPAMSNTVTMTETLGVPAGVSITAVPNPFCPGSSVTCTATPNNGGTNPIYQWKVNGLTVGANSTTYTFNPLNNDSVRCVMTSNLSCVSGNPASSNKIILSGTLAPVVTFTSCFDTITTLNAKPIKLKGGIPLNGFYSGAGVSAGVFDPAVAGVGTKTITYTYTNVYLCSANKSKTIIVQDTAPFICDNMLTDIRDGKTYPSVQIGTQCWMAANLNRGVQTISSQVQFDNCIDEKFCYGNDPAKCSKYGGLYQWDEIMRYDDVPAGQGICPPGWHVPTENDWTILCNYYNGFGFAGKPLQDLFISGFRALTGGVFYLNSSWSFEDFAVLFWTSTSWGNYKALSHGMNSIDFSVSLYPSSRANAFPIRCLKD